MNEKSISPALYYIVFATLALLTLLTCGISFLHEAPAWHTVVGLAIAAVKATLVALYFMHLLHSGRVTWLAVLAALFWLAIMLGLTLADFLTRHWLAY
ncbi:MAG TPA: cytochrome C oxidase subunit IV family protein [Pirellulales bacterium]|nr:cytochrome C oxidase subunit IV family protein [Pirellulales bacterium]